MILPIFQLIFSKQVTRRHVFLPNRSLLNGSAGLVIKRGATVDNNEERDKKSSLEVLGDLFL